jgi:hypothetical protein
LSYVNIQSIQDHQRQAPRTRHGVLYVVGYRWLWQSPTVARIESPGVVSSEDSRMKQLKAVQANRALPMEDRDKQVTALLQLPTLDQFIETSLRQLEQGELQGHRTALPLWPSFGAGNTCVYFDADGKTLRRSRVWNFKDYYIRSNGVSSS